jgi:hypothetical protein
MANEITQTTTLLASKGGAAVSMTASTRIDMTGNGMVQATQSIGTTAELVDFADLAGAPASVAIKNLDPTNFIEIGGDSGLTVFKLKLRAGQSALFQPSSATLYAKADTAAVRVQIVAMDI